MGGDKSRKTGGSLVGSLYDLLCHAKKLGHDLRINGAPLKAFR